MYNKTPSSLAFGIGKDIWQWLLRKMASDNARQYYACDKRQFKYYWETPSPGLPDSNAKPRSPIVVSSNNQCLSRPSEKLSRLCLTSSSEIGLSSVCLLGNHLFFLSLTQLDFKCFTLELISSSCFSEIVLHLPVYLSNHVDTIFQYLKLLISDKNVQTQMLLHERSLQI